MRGDSDEYKVMTAMENDKFRMEEGYEVEVIANIVKNSQQAMMKYFEDAIRAQREKQSAQSATPSEGAVPSLKTKADEDQEWSDVEEADDGKPHVTKTIELA